MLIDVAEVSVVFNTAQGFVVALNTLSIQVDAGQFVCVVGPSGCGKSTLLSVMAGLEHPTTGSVRVRGHVLKGPNADAGVMFQKDLLVDWRNVLRNVTLQYEMRGIRVLPEHERRARLLLDSVGIGQFAESYPYQLSGGMRQRVAICRALVHDPQLLLLDEPMGALDTITREQLNFDLAKITADDTKTTVLVTHSIEEAVFLADRVVVLSAAPASIVADISVELPRPRSVWPIAEPAFSPYLKAVRDALEAGGAYDATVSRS